MTNHDDGSGTPAANVAGAAGAGRAKRPTARRTGEPAAAATEEAVPGAAPEPTVAPVAAEPADPPEDPRAPSATPAARQRRPRRAGATVVVTGAAGVVGTALLPRLAGHADVARVVGLDVRRTDVEGVTWKQADVRDPGVAARLRGADAVVHLAVDWALDSARHERSELNVRGTRTVVTAAAAAGVRRVVLVTSATVYGAFPDNPVPLPEDAPLQAVPEGILADLLEIESVADDARRVHPGLEVVVVRPAALVGRGVDTLVTRHFAAPRLLCIKDTAPTWQFCHVDDLASALVVAALGGVSGAVTVGCDGYLTQERLEDLSGMKRVEVSSSLAFATAERLHRVGVTPAPASELAYVMHPLVVPSAALRAAGWRPEHDNEDCLRTVLTEVAGDRALVGRRLGRRDATVAGASAAGATVAVLGAAAFVRAARRARTR